MFFLEEKTATLEKNLKSNNLEHTMAFSMRNWLMFRLFNNPDFLSKSVSYFEKTYDNFKSFPLAICLYAFLLLELDNFTEAEVLINRLKKHKSYYKSNQPEVYCFYLLLDAFWDFKKDKRNSAAKKLFVIQTFVDSMELKNCYSLLAFLEIELGKFTEAFRNLKKAQELGDRSCFFYYSLYGFFSEIRYSIDIDYSLIYPLIKWSSANKLDISQIVENHQNGILSNPSEFFVLSETLFRQYKSDWLLKEICKNLLRNKDCSLEAFPFYKEAEYRQLETNELYYYLVYSAYNNSIETISRYSIEQFIKQRKSETELDVFVYHLIITYKENSGLLSIFDKQIINFGILNFDLNRTDRYFNSIYKLIVDSGSKNKLDTDLIAEARARLTGSLFKFDITVENKNVSSVWIYEKELKDVKIYNLTDGKATISAINEEFEYILFSAGQKAILNEKARFRKKIETADIRLYARFANSELYTTELLIALSKYAIGLEKPGIEWSYILQKTLEDTKISRSFKMKCSACLGGISAENNESEKAAEVFKYVDENQLGQLQLEQLLLAYVNTGYFEKAKTILLKRIDDISQKTLFVATKKIIDAKLSQKELAGVAFDLIISGWFDEVLLRCVLDHFNGSKSEWFELSKLLEDLSVSEPKIDEILIKNTIWTHSFDLEAQLVFKRVFERGLNVQLIDDFLTYASYEVIRNGVLPDNSTIAALEERCLETDSFMFAIALSHYYLKNKIKTENFDSIIQKTVTESYEKQVFFPILKEVKDKKNSLPYIEKNQPFMFVGRPDLQVYLYFRYEGETVFKVKQMTYFRFGIYLAAVPIFFGDAITAYFSETTNKGSVETKEITVSNKQMSLSEQVQDDFFFINNALVYEQLFRYDKVEEMIEERLREDARIKSWIL